MNRTTITPETYQRYAARPSLFRRALLVDADGEVEPFADVMDDWQKADFKSLDPALKRAVGRSDKPCKMRCYLERPRGHSKTTDLAVTCIWALTFATRPLRGFCFAADREQAKLLKDAMNTIIRLNPWLARLLVVQRNEVVNIAPGHPAEGSKLEISTSDVASSYGILPDLIICDELCHWLGDGSLWHSIISSAAKKENCLLVVISNAGFELSWQWQIREAARLADDWIFSRLDGPTASWITPKRLEEQKRMLPSIAFNRLWLNQWSTGGGDALTPADIDAAFISDLEPMTGSEQDWLFVAGVDLGLTRDCAAVVVLGIPAGGRSPRIRLAHHKLWRPTLGKKINLLDVERHILELDERFGLEFVAFDPWQAEHMAQTLEADSDHDRRNQGRRFYTEPWMRDIPPTVTNLREQATLTIESFQDRRLQFFECEPLRRDLLKLRVEEKSYGIRLTSPKDGEGHGDTFSAFALALLVAHELAGKSPTILGVMGQEPGGSRLDAFLQRERQRERELEMLSQPEDPHSLKTALVNSFGSNPFNI